LSPDVNLVMDLQIINRHFHCALMLEFMFIIQEDR
jgi:hypothetical protein